MAGLFDKNVLTGIELKNRFVRSATYEGMAADDGAATDLMGDLLVDLVNGGVGLLISGHAYISPEGKASNLQLGVYCDSLKESLSKMTASIHAAGGKILMQLAHAGGQANPKVTGVDSIGPSAFDGPNGAVCKEMTVDDISRVIDAFGAAGKRAKDCGFDGVQIHAAHGYLLSQFLSGYFNKRTDEYGGSVENRARIVVGVLKSIKAQVGDDFPVHIKMNSEDFLEGGLTVDEMLEVVKILEANGIGAVELSGGALGSKPDVSPVRPEKKGAADWEVFYRDAAKKFKEQASVPLILVGGMRSFDVCKEVVENGVADYISMSRALVREPGLVNRWESGDTAKATCISCNGCFGPALKGEGIYCVVEARAQKRSV
jgi:2,4-dienoyl-CoA reductase-like NADH-dependent reductase (Old Yellow Enzyme family)